MTQAVIVRRDGDTFQARLFWLHAARLLDPQSPIVRVGFETGPKSFDDIWVEYDPARSAVDQYGDPLRREHIQCKWHVSPDSYGYAHLIDPEFINANTRSLLQRAREAQLAYAPGGTGVRFKLLTNWSLDRADPLREMIGNRSGAMRLNKLYCSTTDNSRAGAVRKAWREHLAIDEDELKLLARTLAFAQATETLDGLREYLDAVFGLVGLRRIPAKESAFPYDDTIFQWMAQGRLEFDRSTFPAICRREGLIGQANSPPRVYGVKSFEHPIDRLDERCFSVLDLIPAFDERHIRSDADWQATLYPALRAFLVDAARDQSRLRLALDAHISLAFAAGSILNIKSGRHVELEQRTFGRRVWAADDLTPDPSWPSVVSNTEVFKPGNAEIAVAIGLTHRITDDVRRYIESELPVVSKLIAFNLSIGASASSVACGRHAYEIAESIAAEVRAARTTSKGPIHLFIAAPNAFTFFLGQRQPAMGSIRLYEFDFEGVRDRSYTPALNLPIAATTSPK
ncbi:MAG: SAVED domain-containing protein [Hyphomonas sp.]|nr:SAVED domain-containing protein [Hyphomonas sp.]